MQERSGEVLQGIPALANVDPDTFGICLATADGCVYEAGDTGLPFCIQSISKAFTYGIALCGQRHEARSTRRSTWSRRASCSTRSACIPVTAPPAQPDDQRGRHRRVAAWSPATTCDASGRAHARATYSDYAGRQLAIDEEIYASMLESGHRNRAISHMLREFEHPATARPTRRSRCTCASARSMVTCRDLALMGGDAGQPAASTRARARRCSPQIFTERVLSVMSTCGMYDAAGEWVASVGMPAKSGVGGGIVAVLPGQLALAVFSPRLDEHGNSVRGVQACRQLSQDLELHEFHVTRAAHSAIRDQYDILEAPSALQRPPADRQVLERYGRRARIYEVHGDLLFAGAESVVREIANAGGDLELLVLDVRRIGEVSDIARRLLVSLRASLLERDCGAALIDPDGRLPAPDDGVDDPIRRFHDAAGSHRCGARTSCSGATRRARRTPTRSSGWPTTRRCGVPARTCWRRWSGGSWRASTPTAS